MSPTLGRRLLRTAKLLSLASLFLFGVIASAHAGQITTWSSLQPKGTTGTNVPIVAIGTGPSDGVPLVSATAKLYVDGALVPRSSYTASIGSASAYFYYSPNPSLEDGPHTFRVEVSDSRGVTSMREWGAAIAQPPNAAWVAPADNATLSHGYPTVLMSMSDNTPGTTFSVVGEVHSGSATGPVAGTFGGTSSGSGAFTLSSELAPGTYFLTAQVTDGAGNVRLLQGAASRRFTTSAPAAMTVLETCEPCHPTYDTEHPTPSTADCGVCHPGYGDDHMEGTEYCEDCHYDGWHIDGDGEAVAVDSPCTGCHNPDRADVPRHTRTSVDAEHASSCAGCHTGSLLPRHATTPDGSSYPNQCDLCHASDDADVAAAIAAGDAACSACHEVEDDHGFDPAMHTASIDTLGLDGTWPYLDTSVSVNGVLMNVPYAYENVVCLGCHTSTIGGPGGEHGRESASSASAGCAACHPSPVSDGGMERPWDGSCYACHPQTSVHAPGGLSAVHTLADADVTDQGSCGFTSPINGRRPCHYNDIVQEHNRLISPRLDLPNIQRSVTCEQCHESPVTVAALADGWNGTCDDCHDGTDLPNHTVAGTDRADAVYALHDNPGGYYEDGGTVSGWNAIDAHGPIRPNPNTSAANKTLGCGAPTCHTGASYGGGWPFGAGPACAECHGPNVAPVPPFEGAWAWSSGTASDGQMLETDLTVAVPALSEGSALTFKTLYDIEENFDFGYVQVSTDDGSTWSNLAGSITTTANEFGLNLGNGITGTSSGWVDGYFDLSDYAGQAVKIRFAYLTDQYVFGSGWKLDLIAVGPTGAPVFTNDAETDDPAMVVESHLGFWEYDEEIDDEVWVTVPTSNGWARYTN